ncbi:GNAT family N-acetyltransferase [Streptococcus mutans]|uniref:GNAT family N-acetyltransferase n=1 Tax=Streptococcus mutans TaxID=1309 RepID=UPI0038BA69E3
MLEIRQLQLNDALAFERFQASLLTEAKNNSFVEPFVTTITSFTQFLERSKQCELSVGNSAWSVFSSYYAFIDGEIVGKLQCFWQSDKADIKRIGNIGYITLASHRRQGIAEKMLSFALERFKEHGHQKILVTAPENNLPSRSLLEKIGGQLEGIVRETYRGQDIQLARYWIDLE